MVVGWEFTDRRGGVSVAPYDAANLGLHVGDDRNAVIVNRSDLARRIGVSALATMAQVHGDAVLQVSEAGEAGECDALITTEPDIALVVQVADCVPLLLADEATGVIAAVHAGWKGAAADIAARAVERMRALGAQHIQGWVGPSICGSCYEVGPEVVEQVAAVMPTAPGRTSWGTPSVDLRAGMVERLSRLNVAATLIGGCTLEEPDVWFSYRRDGVTGRQAGVIWMR